MSQTYDLLPVHGQLRLPMHVQEMLVSVGSVCNDLALAVDEALLLDRRAAHLGEAAPGSPALAGWWRGLAGHRSRAAVSHLEQMTAIYALGVAAYAGYAAALAGALVGGATLPAWPGSPTRPSQLLRQPEVFLPLVQLVDDRAGIDTADCNEQLRQCHRQALEAAGSVASAGLADAYDNPAALACRPDGSVDVGVLYPQALHRYAAECVWAVGLLTRQVDEPAA
jgi:hypothetical protein